MTSVDLLKDSPKKIFFRYLIPSISATLVTSIYILADSVMIGKGVGADGIAAINIVIPIFTLFFGLGLLFGVGGSVLMSVANGSNHPQLGKKYFTTSFYSVGLVSVLLLIILQFGFEHIVYWLGATDATYELASEYGRILICGAPLFMYNSMLQAFVRNDKDPNLSMIGVISGGITNIVFDYIFIYLFHWGMSGGAIATLMGSAVTVSVISIHFMKKTNGLKLVKHGFSVKRVGKIASNGLSSFFVEMASGIITIIFNIQLVRYIGDIGITVYSIISNSSFVVMSLANGVAQAAQPIVAINFGANNMERVKKVFRLGSITTAFIGAVITVIGFTFPQGVTAMFVHSTDEILQIAIPAIRTYIIAFFFMSLNIFISNYFQSVMKANYALVMNILRGLVISSGLLIVLPLLIGASGIWVAMPIVEIIVFLVALLMKRRADICN